MFGRLFFKSRVRQVSSHSAVNSSSIKYSSLFVVSIDYKKPLEEVDRYLQLHKLFLDEGYSSGYFIASGRKVPRTGGIILASFQDRFLLEEFIEKDPFKIHDIASYTITEFTPSMCDDQVLTLRKLM